MNKVQIILRTLLVLELIGICYLSLKSPDGGVQVKLNDKIGHFIGYSILSLNTFLVFGLKPTKKGMLLIFGLLGLGGLLEIFQGYVPGREVSMMDIVANSIGVAIGSSFYFWWRRYQASSKIS